MAMDERRPPFAASPVRGRRISRLRVGEISIAGIVDGQVSLPRDYYTGVDWSAQSSLLSPSGRVERPIGCFLVAQGAQKILVDSGLGPRRLDWAVGGDLVSELAALGVGVGELDVVVITHAHIDHVGGVTASSSAFARIPVILGRREAEAIKRSASWSLFDTRMRSGLLRLVDDGDTIMPEVSIRETPGHTMGHISMVVGPHHERAFLLGDVVVCPEEIGERWVNTSDVDPGLARRTREALWLEAEDTGARVVGAHFPGLRFGRVQPMGDGRRFVPDDNP